MLDDSINLLEELDNVSKIHILDRDDIDALMLEFASRLAATLHIERINVWLFNKEKDALISIAEYDMRTREFSKENVLREEDCPGFFKALGENKIVLVPNISHNPAIRKFSKSYSTPNDIISLMDVPLRIAGELVGVLCFEKTGDKERIFSEKEQTFALSVSLVLASNLEARHRRAAQHKLELLLDEKDLLIHEINHRVKNNFSILVSLLRISRMQKPKDKSNVLLEEYEQRILSMLKIQEMLYKTKNYVSVNFSDYLRELVKEYKKSYPEIGPSVKASIKRLNCELPSKTALHVGLIVTEILINAAKYGYPRKKGFELHVGLIQDASKNLVLSIENNGKGFDFKEQLKKNSLGLSLIKNLSDDSDVIARFPDGKDCFYQFTFLPKTYIQI
jgi:two-component sensor histidine kinase